MGNLTINNGGIITNSNNLPNIDLRYGPYNSLDSAYGSLGQSLVPGLVIGVIRDDGKITEYQAQRGGGGNIELVPRSVIISYEDLDDLPEITDGTNNAELKGTIEVSATSGNVAGVNIDTNTPGTIGLEFTLPKGADGQDGAPGNDGHNPCLGVFADAASLPTVGVRDGDYTYATVDGVSYIYRYNNGWVQGEAGSPNQSVVFHSGESVVDTMIDNTQLQNPQDNALANAYDVSKRIGDMGEDETLLADGDYSVEEGVYVNGNTGELIPATGATCAKIDVGNCSRVKFLGVASPNANAGYTFKDVDDVVIESHPWDAPDSGTKVVFKLYDIGVPKNAKWLYTLKNSTTYTNLAESFWANTVKSKSVSDRVDEAMSAVVEDGTWLDITGNGNNVIGLLANANGSTTYNRDGVSEYLHKVTETARNSTFSMYNIENVERVRINKTTANPTIAFFTQRVSSVGSGYNLAVSEGYIAGTKRTLTETEEIKVPVNAKWLYYLKNYNGTEVNAGIEIYIQGENIKRRVDKIEHEMEKTNSFFQNIEAGQDAEVVGEEITMLPAVDDTCNALMKETGTYKFVETGNYLKRLCYFPKVIINGGDEITIQSKDKTSLIMYELPYKSLDTGLVEAGYLITDVIKQTTIPRNRETTVVTQKNTRRIVLYMGYTENDYTQTDISPEDVSEWLASVTLSKRSGENVIIGSGGVIETRKDEILEELSGTKYFGILHFSDIHGVQRAAEQIKKERTKHLELIDDTLCTGDVVGYFADGTSSSSYADAQEGSTWWTEESELASISLFALGNHDGATAADTDYDVKDGSAAWDGKGREWDYDTYFAPYINNLGITMPAGHDDTISVYYKSCFWHKDYPAKKLRIICIDGIHYFDGILERDSNGDFVTTSNGLLAINTAGLKHLTTEQETWLKARLDETLDENNTAYKYSVVFVCHYALDDFDGYNMEWDDTAHRWQYNQRTVGGVVMDNRMNEEPANFHYAGHSTYEAERKFNLRNRLATGNSYTKGSINNIGDIISHWVDDGGKYICWLCGHRHLDYFTYPTNYPTLLQITITQAGNNRSPLGVRTSDKKVYACNLIRIAYSEENNEIIYKGLNIVRLGYDFNYGRRSSQHITYNLETKKVISSS